MSKDLKAIIKEKLTAGVSMDDLLTEISDTINDTNDELEAEKTAKAEKEKDFQIVADILSKYMDEPVAAEDLIKSIEWVNDVEKGFKRIPSSLHDIPTIFKFKI